MENIIKKILLFCSIVFTLLIVGINSISAQVPINVTNPIDTSDFAVLISNVLKWILSVAGSLTLLMFVAGGVLYVTSAGNEQKVETAKKMVTWTLLGLMLILASYSIIVVLDTILT